MGKFCGKTRALFLKTRTRDAVESPFCFNDGGPCEAIVTRRDNGIEKTRADPGILHLNHAGATTCDPANGGCGRNGRAPRCDDKIRPWGRQGPTL